MNMIFLNISQWQQNGKGRMKTQGNNNESTPDIPDERIGKIFWFEYRFFDSFKSYNPELWFRSHQQVTVISIVEPGVGKSMADRTENGAPRFYNIKFEDGYEHKVSEKELLSSKEDFYPTNNTDNK